MIEARFLKKYQLHPDAEVTVLLYSNQVIRVNRAYKKDEFTEKLAREVGEEAAKFLAAK
jgi:antitoxin component of MazEF toxin-antitoxin module